MTHGIDVSYHQGVIDWNLVKDNIDFAIIRAGYGAGNIDKQAERNAEECDRLKIPYGFYWFSYAGTIDEVVIEACHFIDFAKKFTPTFPLYFDYEYASDRYNHTRGISLSKSELSEMAKAFCKFLESFGYYAGIYTNKDFKENRFDKELFNMFDIWYARYTVRPQNYNLWQYTSVGGIKGISGYVDMNYCKRDYPRIIKKAGLNKYGMDR